MVNDGEISAVVTQQQDADWHFDYHHSHAAPEPQQLPSVNDSNEKGEGRIAVEDVARDEHDDGSVRRSLPGASSTAPPLSNLPSAQPGTSSSSSIGGHSSSRDRRGGVGKGRYSCLRLPLWLGCAVLCMILVGGVGVAPFLVGQSGNRIIVTEALNAYNTAISLTGQAIYEKFVSEVISLVIAHAQAYGRPLLFTAVNFTNPMWDVHWHTFFAGVETLHSDRRFYYMDLATSTFTAQSIRNDSRIRYVGSANDVNFIEFQRSTSPPMVFVDTGNHATFRFPPMELFMHFISTAQPAAILTPMLDVTGEMVYGFGTYVESPFSPGHPVGIALELLPLEQVLITESLDRFGLGRTEVARLSGDSIVLDEQGALVSCSMPALQNIYVPIGTPGSICTTIVHANITTSKCRHSLETIRTIWPVTHAAYQAILRVGVAEGASTLRYVTFDFEGNEYLVSATSPRLDDKTVWWAAAITPTAPVYGPYIDNRQSILITIIAVCVSIALLVLILTYILLIPLGRLMEQMIAALMLQTQSDRYARGVSRDGSFSSIHNPNTDPSLSAVGSSVELCGGRRLHISELHDIEVAVARLHCILEDVAKMLPPPVILTIRTSLALRSTVGSERQGNMSDDTGSSLSSSDQATIDQVPHHRTHGNPIAGTAADDEHIAQMLSWVEAYYHHKGMSSTSSAASPIVSGSDNEMTKEEDAPYPSSSNTFAGSHDNTVAVVEEGGAEDKHVTFGILMSPSVSLRPARRRGFFMAVSLCDVSCEPAEFPEVIAPLLAQIWHCGGEIEMIERHMLVATFGCYSQHEDAADRAVTCAMAIVERRVPKGARGRLNNPTAIAVRSSRNTDEDNVRSLGRRSSTPTTPLFAASLRAPDYFVSIDCGWFETSTFSCSEPSGRIIRRQLVNSVAREVAVKLLPLGEVLHERLLISGDALRHLDPQTLLGRVPVIVDHLKFDSRSWSRISRRGSVFIFSIPPAGGSSTLVPPSVSDAYKNEARVVAEGFRLMIHAKYAEAEQFLKRWFQNGDGGSRYVARMMALSSVFANILRVAPNTELAPYYRGECSLFEATAEESAAQSRADTHVPGRSTSTTLVDRFVLQ